LGHVLDVIGKAEGVLGVSALSTLIMPSGTFFLCDTQVSEKPTVEELAEMIRLSAEAVSRLGEVPKIA
jgi:malate dehydrogenase (oxaloacetate-decarboxylating)(NADP+)